MLPAGATVEFKGLSTAGAEAVGGLGILESREVE